MSYEWFANRYPMRAHVDYRTGGAYEVVRPNAPAVTGTQPTILPGRGLVNVAAANQYLQYNAADYDITDTTRPLTLVAVFTMRAACVSGVNPTIALKNAALGWSLQVRGINAAPQLYMETAGGVLMVQPVPVVNMSQRIGTPRIIVITYNGGLRAAGVQGWIDGVLSPNSVSTDTLTAGTTANATGLRVGGGANTSLTAPAITGMFAWIDQQVTAAQATEIYEMLATERPASSRSYRKIVAPYPCRTPAEYAANGPLADWDMSTVNGKLVDLTPGNRVGTPSGAIDTVAGPFGQQAKEFWPGSKYTLPSDSTMFRTNDMSTMFLWRQRVASAGNSAILSSTSDLDFAIQQSSVSRITLRTKDGAGVVRAVSTPNNTIPNGVFTHVVASKKLVGADLYLSIKVNSLLVASAIYAGAGVSIPAASAIAIGRVLTDPTISGALAQLRPFTRATTPEEDRKAYTDTDYTILDARLEKTGATPVTPVAVTGAQQMIPGTPWKTNAAGNWKLIEAAPVGTVLGKRTISYSTSGDFIYAADTEAFGAWYFDVVFTTTADTYVNLVADKAAATVAPLGYAVRFSSSGRVEMVRTTGVGAAQLFFTAAGYLTNGVTYSCMVTRTVLGQFALWIKGGVYAEYTLMAPAGGANPTAVDLTYTTSKYAVWNRNGGTGALGDFLHRSCALTPQEAQAKGLITGVPVYEDPFVFTTTDTSQTWVVTFPAGQQFYVDWGDGFTSPFTGTGANQTVTHAYGGAGTYTVKWYTTDWTTLQYFDCNSNQLSGSLPDFSKCTSLVTFYCYTNQFTGILPDFSKCTSLVNFACYTNQLTGTLPDFSKCTSLAYFACYTNQLTGILPDFSKCTSLVNFACYTNQLTGTLPDFSKCTSLVNFACYTNQLTGTLPDFSKCTSLAYFACYTNQFTGVTLTQRIALTCTTWRAEGNALTLAAVDAMLAAMATDMGLRPINGTMNLSGGTNATPDAAGLANKAIIVARPWTCTTN